MVKFGKESVLIFLKGFLMGIADTIPGVSGGTIAFITGIYHRLIHAFSHINLRFITLSLRGKFKESLNILKNHDWALFIPLGLGIVSAILLFSQVILYLLTNYAGFTFAFFAGLILASALIIQKHTQKFDVKSLFFSVLGFVLAFFLVSETAFSINHSAIVIFLSGFVAISAMLLPGISGAFILLLLGQYNYILDALHNFNFLVILEFALGAILGLLFFSKFLDFLLEKHKNTTYFFLIGLMLGSLRLPYLTIRDTEGFSFLILLFAILAFILVFILEKKANTK